VAILLDFRLPGLGEFGTASLVSIAASDIHWSGRFVLCERKIQAFAYCCQHTS